MYCKIKEYYPPKHHYNPFIAPLGKFHGKIVKTFHRLPKIDPIKEIAIRIIRIVLAPFAYLALSCGALLGLALNGFYKKKHEADKLAELDLEIKKHIEDFVNGKPLKTNNSLETYHLLLAANSLDMPDLIEACRARLGTHEIIHADSAVSSKIVESVLLLDFSTLCKLLPPKDVISFLKRVSAQATQKQLELLNTTIINIINDYKLPLKNSLGVLTAQDALDVLVKMGEAGKKLEHADFEGLKDLDNATLKKLTENCSKLKTLLMKKSKVEGDALKHLKHVKDLQSLNISYCNQLEEDALKHLNHVKGLQSLKIGGCKKLEKDALKLLENVKSLQSLDISWCSQLEEDALKHLNHVKGLQILDIWGCTQLEKDALKYLNHVKGLQSLSISCCSQLEKDALKYLKYVKGLQSLNISWCSHLEEDALKHLEHVKGLQTLNISWCEQLKEDALKHLAHVKELNSLNIWGCTQLEEDALKHLRHVKRLLNLNIEYCNQLEKNWLNMFSSFIKVTD